MTFHRHAFLVAVAAALSLPCSTSYAQTQTLTNASGKVIGYLQQGPGPHEQTMYDCRRSKVGVFSTFKTSTGETYDASGIRKIGNGNLLATLIPRDCL